MLKFYAALFFSLLPYLWVHCSVFPGSTAPAVDPSQITHDSNVERFFDKSTNFVEPVSISAKDELYT